MTVPLIVLAVFAVGVGAALGMPRWPWLSAAWWPYLFAHALHGTLDWPAAGEESMNYAVMVFSSVVALAGIGLAWLMYVRQPDLPGKLAHHARRLYQLSLNKLYFDELYEVLILRPLQFMTELSQRLDSRVVDRLVDRIGQLPGLIGSLFRYVQNGLVQFYALAMVLGLTVFILALVRSL
jgi:NADH-quinone oxidoreductase subunit L